MNAIDTNALVRIIVKDNDIQAKKALNYVKKQSDVFISLVVLMEAIWVFEAAYHLKKQEIMDVVEMILRANQFIVEQSDAVWYALAEYKNTSIEFTDCLIGAIAHQMECDSVATFDKKAAKTTFFKLIS